MTWQNWARTVRIQPAEIARPRDDAEVASVVKAAAAAGQRVKAIGAGHSFTSITATDGVQVRLDHLRGLRSLQPDGARGARATVGAGTTIHELNSLLAAQGYGLANMGDIDVQTVSGAISTGTHGTGRSSASLSAAVSDLRMVLPDGAVVDVGRHDDRSGTELFHAARLGLGAVGIVTAVTFCVEPAFTLRATTEPARLEDVLERLPYLATEEEHCEFYWLPFTGTVQLKRNRRTTDRPSPRGRVASWLANEVVENAGVAAVQRLSRAAPRTTPVLNQAASRLIARRSYVDSAPAVFTSSRRVRFHEMEYALPLAAAAPALRELRDLTARGPWRIAFPVEVRFAPADDVWLSPAHGRDTVYIAVHAYPRTAYSGWFEAVERLWTSYSGRPHWGKLHTKDTGYVRDQYERMGEFVAVRDKVDPRRTMANRYLDRVLGR